MWCGACELMQDLGVYELTVVLPIDPTKQTASLPPYIVTPCRWADHFFNDLGEMKPQIKVYDFGNGQCILVRSVITAD